MLKEITLENVRVFSDAGWRFPLAPLTIFAGTNSAGKSTILKAILLLQQNFQGNTPSSALQGVVRFSGRAVDLGDFRALVSLNERSRPIKIEVVNEDILSSDFRSMLSEFLSEEKFKEVSAYLKKAKRPVYQLKADFQIVDESIIQLAPSSPPGLPLEAADDNSDMSKAVLSSARFEISIAGLSILRWDVSRSAERDATTSPTSSLRYNIFLPSVFMEAAGLTEVLKPESVNDRGYMKFSTVLNGLTPLLIGGPSTSQRKRPQSKKRAEITYVPSPSLISEAISDLSAALRQVQYLGPLRSPGRRYYVLNQDYLSELDTAGEFLPYILRDRKDEEVSFCPPYNIFAEKNAPLAEALNEWIYYLKSEGPPVEKVPVEFRSEFQKQVLGELRLRGQGGRDYALADTGFGYSQVLPILVRGLLTRRYGTFIVEQPELHLHPALQIRLAAFFIGMTYANRSVLLESHSEHLINAVRALAAENPETELFERVKIFYVESGNSKPLVHDLSVRRDGTVPSWPRSFFGEGIGLSARLLKAQRNPTTSSFKR